MKNNTFTKLLTNDLKSAHKYFIETLNEVDDILANKKPSGKAISIAGVYAHLVFSEDFFINVLLQQKTPLFQGAWKSKTGISTPQPDDWANEYPKWLNTVSIKIEEIKNYRDVVFKQTEDYYENLIDIDLTKSVDMSVFGMGQREIGDVLLSMITGHLWSLMGEVSAVKGIYGLKGYPF